MADERAKARRARLARLGKWSAVIVLGSTAAAWTWQRLSFDRAAWLADYEQLREHTARRYANLLWVVDERGLNPVALHQRTLAGLAEANTDRQARAVIESFVAAFDDPHFRIHRVKLSKRLEAWWFGLFAADPDSEPPSAASEAGEVCAALGVLDDPGELSFGLARIEGVAVLAGGDSFPAAIVELDGGRVGIIRIPLFSQQRYRPACERAWTQFAAELNGSCDPGCLEHFFHTVVADRILAELRARIEALADAEVDMIAIDVSGNGGGTDWVDPVARMLSAAPLRCPALGFIKDPHWSERLAATRAVVQAALTAELSTESRVLLDEADERLAALLAAAGEACELGGIWTATERPSCSNLVHGRYFACGVFDHLGPGSLTDVEARAQLFDPLRYHYAEGVWTGPLAVIVDRGTASASEYFAAMLADNHAAVLIGEPTRGVGCGYTGGGVPIVLEHSGLRVELPDCQRLRGDGRNELEGITPELDVGWRADDDEDHRRTKLVAGLELALSATRRSHAHGL